MEMFPWPRIEF